LKILHSNSSKQVVEDQWKEREKETKGGDIITHSHYFKCLGRGHVASQCPTKKIVILRSIGVYSSQDEESDCESEERSESKREDAYPCNGIFL